MMGKAIVAAENGERVGKVADVLIDSESCEVLGVVVAGGILAAEQVLPFDEVQTLGTDAVIVRSAGSVIGRKEWRAQAPDAARFSAMTDRPVITVKGRRVGAIRDVWLSDTSGEIEAFEVGGGRVAGLVQRAIGADGRPFTIGPDAVIVSDESAVIPQGKRH